LACVLPTLPSSKKEDETEEENNAEEEKNKESSNESNEALYCGVTGKKMYEMPQLISQALEEMEETEEDGGFVAADFGGKCVSDIATFLEQWTAKYGHYNTLSCNSQTFAKDLYEFVIGDKYRFQLESIVHKMQSFVDFDREWKKLEEEQNQNLSNPRKDETNSNSDNQSQPK